MANEQKLEYWRARYRQHKTERNAQRGPEPIAQIPEIERAYIAGLIDGEGHLGISPHRAGYLVPIVAVSMCSRPVLDWLAERLGTVCTERLLLNMTKTHSPQYAVKIGGRRAVLLAEILLPYLRVKHEQAALLAAFGATYEYTFSPQTPGLPDHLKVERERLKARMRVLNAKAKSFQSDQTLESLHHPHPGMSRDAV